MAQLLPAGVTMTFVSYEIEDTGVRMKFVATGQPPGRESDYWILITDAEWAGAGNPSARTTLITNKLRRYFLASGIANTLNPVIGQSIVI